VLVLTPDECRLGITRPRHFYYIFLTKLFGFLPHFIYNPSANTSVELPIY